MSKIQNDVLIELNVPALKTGKDIARVRNALLLLPSTKLSEQKKDDLTVLCGYFLRNDGVFVDALPSYKDKPVELVADLQSFFGITAYSEQRNNRTAIFYI